jgi:hypothetical protein
VIHIFSTRQVALWMAAMIIAAIFSWTFFTGWGVTASYVGSHMGVLPESEIQQTRMRARAFLAGIFGAQCLMVWCAAKLISTVRADRSSVIPSFSSLGLGAVLTIATDVAIFGTLMLIQVSGRK